MTLNELTDDIMVTMGYVHDDALRSRIAVMGNVKLAVDKVNDQILSKAIKTGDMRSVSDMLARYAVTLTVHQAGDYLDFDHHSFTLPVDLYSLPYDGGVNMIRYNRNGLPADCPPEFARTTFTGCTLAELSGLYGMTYQRPKASRPYYARDKDRVYVFGVDPSITVLSVWLFGSLPNFVDLDPDAQITLPPEYVDAVKKMIIDLERWVLQIPQQRLKNDGRDLDVNQTIRTERTMSLNDPANLTEF